MPTATRYKSEITMIPLGGKLIPLENRTPILSPKERESRRQEIEKRLFAVFSKYADKSRK